MRRCQIPDVLTVLIATEIRAKSWSVLDQELAGKDKQ